ncbi:AAA ATPase domain-containing protein [Streptomyces sp. yr375]|uniref:helix-turn-helix transcriptional regulator n=1 Tax=Streptomyces sp. yr375 TaxID=1761906 RepID=UPI0008C4CB17|nr:LuxR family transcriptional regulator [Streptomyces sp. yr375]SES10594.1 AAA ATPase domain-containing protein [Streptomyces sp. yr375]
MVEGVWPVTARESELAEIKQWTAAGVGALLVGEHGTGKSTLLNAALEQAERTGTRVVRGDVPGNHLRAALPSQPLSSPARAARRQVAVAIDDVHLADPVTLGLACRLADSGQALLLATAPPGALPGGVRRLLIGKRVRRLGVDALDRSGSVRMLAARLGGPVAVDTAERFWRLTRGNALTLRELADQALAEGTLRPVRGRWQWPGLLGVPDSRLVDLVELLLGDLGPGERELVNMLALAGSLQTGLPIVDELGEAAESLNRRGVLVARRAGFRLDLRLAHPLCEAVVAATLPELTARRLRQRIADAVEDAGAHRPGDAARIAVLGLGAGRLPEPARSRAAAVSALRAEDYPLAERLSRAALAGGAVSGATTGATVGAAARPVSGAAAGVASGVASGTAVGAVCGAAAGAAAGFVTGAVSSTAAGSVTGAVSGAAAGAAPGADDVVVVRLLGEALVGQRRHVEAEAYFAQAAQDAAVLRPRALNMSLGLGRLAEAEAVAETDLGARALVRLVKDRIVHARQLAEAAPDAEPLLALLHHVSGDDDAALAVLSASRPALPGRDEATRLDHLCVTGWLTAYTRGPAEAGEVLAALREQAADDDARARTYADLLEARILRGAGRTAEAVPLLRQAAAYRAPTDWLSTRSWRIAQLAGAVAESGDGLEAVSLLEEARAAQQDECRYPLMADAVELEAALVEACLGDREAAARRALRVAGRALSAARHGQALAAMHLAARAGAATSAVAVWAAACGGPPATTDAVRPRHVLALSRDDGDALDEVARRYDALGLLPLAAEACAQAAHAHQASGDRRKARAAQLAGVALVSRCGSEPPQWAVPAERRGRGSRTGLTAREREIVTLAVSHLSNQEIADRLVLSVRTVENHLYRAYGKLGVTTRSELAPRLGLGPARVGRIA